MESLKAFATTFIVIGGFSYLINHLIQKFKLINDKTMSWFVSIYLAYFLTLSVLINMIRKIVSNYKIDMLQDVLKNIDLSIVIFIVPLFYTAMIGIVRYIIGMFMKDSNEDTKFLSAIAISIAASILIMPSFSTSACACKK